MFFHIAPFAGYDPDKFLEILAFLGLLTLSDSSSPCFDPGVGAGKLPALRADVTGRASLVTPALYPAILFPPPFCHVGARERLDHYPHIPPQMAHSGGLECRGGLGCPAWQEGHKSAHSGLHGGLGCEAGFGYIYLQFLELSLIINIHGVLDGTDGVTECTIALLTGLGNNAGVLNADKSLFTEFGNVLLNCVYAHANRPSYGFVTGMTLISFTVFAVEQIRIDRNFSRG